MIKIKIICFYIKILEVILNKDYVIIKCDCWFIAQRLKEIDSSYYIVFNLSNQKYEVHSYLQAKNSYCFTLPFNELDERTLNFALKTRRENQDQLIKEIEENNRVIYEKNIKEQINTLKEALSL